MQAYERTRHQTEGGLMPLVDGLAAVNEPRWLALLNGGKASAPKGTDREGNPEGRIYASAHIGGTPDSESAYKLTRCHTRSPWAGSKDTRRVK